MTFFYGGLIVGLVIGFLAGVFLYQLLDVVLACH